MNNEHCPLCGNKYQDVGENDLSKSEKINMFNDFWEAYPKKIHKNEAFIEFTNANFDDIKKLLHAVRDQASSPEWMSGDGKYIPSPASWLKNERWLDSGVDKKAIRDAINKKSIEKLLNEKKKEQEYMNRSYFEWRMEYADDTLPFGVTIEDFNDYPFDQWDDELKERYNEYIKNSWTEIKGSIDGYSSEIFSNSYRKDDSLEYAPIR